MHKMECKKRAAELHDEALFKQSQPREDCDVCMIPLPLSPTETSYQACCGKTICLGCMHGVYKGDERCICPFCRSPAYSTEREQIKRLKKRAEGGDGAAMHNLGCIYNGGDLGLPQDTKKAMELWLRAGELGRIWPYYKLGIHYYSGEGVERDVKKAKHFWEIGAMRGDAEARHSMGVLENNAGNAVRAAKHWMISAQAGHDGSLTAIREYFLKGFVTKDDFEKALRAHKESKDMMKSEQREAAATWSKRNATCFLPDSGASPGGRFY